jgi:hypothetical protein
MTVAHNTITLSELQAVDFPELFRPQNAGAATQMSHPKRIVLFVVSALVVSTALEHALAAPPPSAAANNAANQGKAARAPKASWVVPKLPDGKMSLTDSSPDFLKPVGPLKEGVSIAKTPPTVDVLVYPGQDYEGKPWSNWGDGCFAKGKYYSAIGDHLSPAGTGRVFEYDPATKTMRRIADLKTHYNRPEGHYSPAKIHSRLDMGSDGWIYFSTHRGSPSTSTDTYHYQGDDILRVDPATAKVEVVAQGPVAKHCIPTSVLDPERMIFYGGTAPGKDSTSQAVQFLAYDVRNHKVLYRGDDGPPRCLIRSSSTGRVYYVPGSNAKGKLVRFDPASPGTPTPIDAEIGIRAATTETPQGIIYAVSTGQGGNDPEIFAFNVKTERAEKIGTASIGVETYIASMDADPSGRYLYYIPGAHGSAPRDGTPVIQFDTKTRTRKVIAFLHSYYQNTYGFSPSGTYCSVLNDDGSTLFVTFNTNRGTKVWDYCTLFAIHIPESERQP